MHATAAAERGIVRLRPQVSGKDMKLLRVISAMLSAAILPLARSMDISHLYSRPALRFMAESNAEPTTEHSTRVV